MTDEISAPEKPPASLAHPEAETLRQENRQWAGKLILLAWTIEIVLVTVGLGVAFAQATSVPAGSSFAQAVPVFGVFVVLAAVELAKIPAATVVFHARGIARYLALCGLFVASVISFETVFNGIERYVHVTTAPVSEARATHQKLLGEIASLKSVALEDDLTGDDIAAVDAERLAQLEQSLAMRENALQTARENLESSETRELKAQLANLLQQQDEAGEAAAQAWQQEQEWIMTRLNGDGIDNRTRAQLNNRMRTMPAKQSVITEARVMFDAEIMKLNQEVEASITQPSPEALADVETKKAERDEAAATLAAFERDSAARASERMTALLGIQAAKTERSRNIEALEAEAVEAENNIAHAANLSQMHRWASFVFGVEPGAVQDNQAKRVGAVFGAILGIVAALTGSTVAMYSQWFRVRGMQPVIRTEQVEIEKIIEKEIEVPVEVEVPVLKHVYVPVPVGGDVEDDINAILEALPPDAAEDLRRQLAAGFKSDDTGNDSPKGAPYARAA
ncbi:hypothetical protein [Shimia sp. SDUM112013]|uniref:hypothetical protein n=1 Tax=Shimia sp. SDUM112013 TaxID=3136160 RepID=UPI0032EBE854